jgi:predicted DNA-binding protein
VSDHLETTEVPIKQKIYSVRLTKDQAAQLKQIADRENRTISNKVFDIIVKYLEKVNSDPLFVE